MDPPSFKAHELITRRRLVLLFRMSNKISNKIIYYLSFFPGASSQIGDKEVLRIYEVLFIKNEEVRYNEWNSFFLKIVMELPYNSVFHNGTNRSPSGLFKENIIYCWFHNVESVKNCNCVTMCIGETYIKLQLCREVSVSQTVDREGSLWIRDLFQSPIKIETLTLISRTILLEN